MGRWSGETGSRKYILISIMDGLEDEVVLGYLHTKHSHLPIYASQRGLPTILPQRYESYKINNANHLVLACPYALEV
jgi:hypothetical protein